MILNKSQTKQLNTAIESAIDKLYEKDIYLIQTRVHERAIVSRFNIYFQQALNLTEFKSYNLDFEYNKDHSNPKRTVNFRNGTYPDIILHQRGNNEANILVIEFKTWWGKNTDDDIKKLKDFTNQKGKYKYAMGYSIVLNKERTLLSETFVVNGEVCND